MDGEGGHMTKRYTFRPPEKQTHPESEKRANIAPFLGGFLATPDEAKDLWQQK